MSSTNYRDYFIRDGRFVGAFEEMYRNCPDPWQQDSGESLVEDVAISLLRKQSPRRILDLGCGKGRFSHRIRETTGANVVGTDVSPTAIVAARSRYDSIDFVLARVPPVPFGNAVFDAVVTSALLWCVLPDMPSLFHEIKRVLSPKGCFLVVETFYQPGQQRYGNHVMKTPEDLLRQLPFRVNQFVEFDRLSNHRIIALLEPV